MWLVSLKWAINIDFGHISWVKLKFSLLSSRNVDVVFDSKLFNQKKPVKADIIQKNNNLIFKKSYSEIHK